MRSNNVGVDASRTQRNSSTFKRHICSDTLGKKPQHTQRDPTPPHTEMKREKGRGEKQRKRTVKDVDGTVGCKTKERIPAVLSASWGVFVFFSLPRFYHHALSAEKEREQR